MESADKPKRVLTEAQRLAFLKGREKRLANLERKRQEKMEAMDPPAEEQAPVEPEPAPVLPPPSPPVRSQSLPNLDEWAVKVADMVYERIKPPPPPPSPKPKSESVKRPAPPKVEFLWA